MSKKKSIKDWAKDDRPREKMAEKGKAAMSDSELLAILLRTGKEEQSAVDLAREILGKAKAVTIMAALELGKRRRGAEANLPDEVKDSTTSFERFISHIDDMKQEHFLVMYLDQSFHELKVECISNGGTTNVIADPRIIFKHALNYGATCIILGHNHPSGNPRPSKDDRLLTQKIVSAGQLLDIAVVDHIVIGNERYYSFRDHGEMTF